MVFENMNYFNFSDEMRNLANIAIVGLKTRKKLENERQGK
jgi:hypothetical protein